jgi:stress response protein YsnF
MALIRLNEIDPHHHRTVRGKDIRRFQIFSRQNQRIGKITDALLDNTNQFHYLIADVYSPRTSQNVLIPIRQTQVDLEGERVYLPDLDATQIAALPTYSVTDQREVVGLEKAASTQSYAAEPTVLILEDSVPLEAVTPLESVTPVEAPVVKLVRPVTTSVTNQASVEISPVAHGSIKQPTPQSTSLDQISVSKQAKQPEMAQSQLRAASDVVDERNIQLLEERLFVDRQKRKVGEVIVRKTIETQIVEIPIRRERLIVEQISPEHKELASIDLSKGHLDGVDLINTSQLPLPNAASQTTSDAAPLSPNAEVISSEFSSTEAAIEFLRAIAAQSHDAPQRIQIHLIK